MKLLKLIRSLDYFGHRIELNFRKEGSSHNTLIGGIMSIFVRVFMAYYIFSLTSTLVNYLDDKNKTTLIVQDFSETEDIRLNETNSLMYLGILNKTDKYQPIDYEELRKHVRVKTGE